MANVTLPIWLGARTSYDALATKQTGIIYCALGTNGQWQMYLNNAPINMEIAFVSALPTGDDRKEGVVYLNMTNDSLQYWSGAEWKSLSGGGAVPSDVVEYKGILDASDPTENPAWTNAGLGNLFIVSTAGAIDGKAVGVGDWIIINTEVTGTPTAADFDVISKADIPVANNLTTTDAGYVLDARQGKVLKDAIDLKMNLVTGATLDNIATFANATGQVKDSGLSVAFAVTDVPLATKLTTELAVVNALKFGTF